MALSNQATINLAVNIQNMPGLIALNSQLSRLVKIVQAAQRSPAVRSATGANSPAQQARQQAALAQAVQRLEAAQMRGAITAARYQLAMQRIAQAQQKLVGQTKPMLTSFDRLRARLGQAEESVDSLWRAAFRLQMLGAKFTQWSKDIFNAFKNIMDVFGEFDFNIRRAAGSIGLFDQENTFLGTGAEGVKNKLGALSSAALDVARDIKFIPAAEVAKGFYFWGSMTGTVVDSMDDLNELVKGHTTVLQAAAMTEVDFETALKGVYSVITQFYHGDLSKTTDVTMELFYAAQKTAVEFGDLIQSFKMVGPVAAALNVDFEDVLVTLGDLGDLGMRGSLAGRALRQIFIQLAKPSAQAKKALEDAFSIFKGTTLTDNAKRVLSAITTGTTTALQNIENAGSYYDAVFPEGKYAGIQNQIAVLAAMTMNMSEQSRAALLATMSTANSLPVLMALVGREIRTIQTGIVANTKLHLEDARKYFEDNWNYLSDSWKGAVASIARAWEGLKIIIGGGIAEWAKPVLDTLTQIVDKVREWAEANPKVVATISKFAAFAAILAGITGALLTVAGTLISFGAAIGYFSKFIELGRTAEQTATSLAKSAQAASKGFMAVAKQGLGAFAGALAVLIALITAVERNLGYIKLRFDEVVKIFQTGSGDIGGSLNTVVEFLSGIQEGINEVFDLIVKRVADAIVVLAQLIDFFKQIVAGIGNITAGVPGLDGVRGAFEGIAKAIGMIIAARMITGVLGMFTSFRLIKGMLETMYLRTLMFRDSLVAAKAASTGLAVLPAIGNSIKVAFMGAAGALRGLVASTGIGLLVVGLSILVDMLSQTQKSTTELDEEIKGLAATFGGAADTAEKSARRIAAAQVAAADAAAKAARDAALVGQEPWIQQGPNGPSGFDSETFVGVQGAVDTSDKAAALADAKARSDAAWLVKTNADYAQQIDDAAIAILQDWKGYVDKWNTVLSGSDLHLDPTRWMDIKSMLPDLGNAALSTNQDLIDYIAAFIGSLDPGTSNEQIAQAYDQLGQLLGVDLAKDLGLTLTEAQTMFFDRASQEAKALQVEQAKWSPIVNEIIAKFNPQTTGDWNKLLDYKPFGMFGDTIGELYATGLLDDNTVAAISKGVFGAVDDLAEKVEASDWATPNISKLAEVLPGIITRYLNSAFEGAIPGVQQALANFDAATSGGWDSLNVEDAFVKLFNENIVGLDYGTMYNAIMSGDANAVPEVLRSSYIDAAKQLAAAGSVKAADFLKAIGEGDEGTGDEMAKAFTDFMSGTLDSFVSAVGDGIKSSWKDTIKKLKGLLKPKNSDANQIKILLEKATNKVFTDAMNSTTNTAARETAFDWAENNFIQPTIGGIQAALDAHDTATAKSEMQGFVKDLTAFPDSFWAQLDPTVAQGIKTWLTTQTTGIQAPPSVIAALTAVINSVPQAAIDGVTPVTVNPADLIKFDTKGAAGSGPGGATNPDAGDRGVGGATGGITNYLAGVQKTINDNPLTVPPVGPPDTTPVTTAVNTMSTTISTSIAGINTTIPAIVSPDTQPAKDKILDLCTFITNNLNYLQYLADDWGRHMVEAYAGAITANKWKATDAARDVAQAVADILKMSAPPKKGPLRRMDLWGAHFVEAYAKAIKSNNPKVRAAAEAIAQTLRDALEPDGKKNWIDDPKKAGKKAADDADKVAKKVITSVKGAHLFDSYKDYLAYLTKVHNRIKDTNDKIKKDREHAHRDLTVDKNNKDNKVTYENNKKVVVEVHLIAESPDGTVNRVELRELRKGIMDALVLADLEHIVQVQ